MTLFLKYYSIKAKNVRVRYDRVSYMNHKVLGWSSNACSVSNNCSKPATYRSVLIVSLKKKGPMMPLLDTSSPQTVKFWVVVLHTNAGFRYPKIANFDCSQNHPVKKGLTYELYASNIEFIIINHYEHIFLEPPL